MEYSLFDPPDGVDVALWRGGVPGEAKTGDIWLMSWDGRALGLGVIAGFGSDFIHMWPVTLPGELAFRPAVVAPDSPFGVPLTVWPSRETPMGYHLLHRGFGHVLPANAMALIEDAVEDGAAILDPHRYAPDRIDTRECEAADGEMLNQWDAIFWNVWPPSAVGSMPFNIGLLRERGFAPGRIAAVLGVDTSMVLGLVEQTEYPSAEQVQAIAAAAGVAEPIDLLSPVSNEGVFAQLSPTLKDEVLRVGRHLNLHEAKARDAILSEFALAARAENQEGRARGAIGRLLAR
ncbi:MAG: hypothetical protein LBT54_06035 [Bifidobacteriaceae bacterium]|nr:hypothetical protein [Bifidobacteriaceae bacterium]